MRPDALESALARARASGRRTIAVVGSACSTATGAIDPLAYLADFAERNGLWFHVDGAHGASFVLSPRLRPRFSGIERAHSVVWDAHKMLRVPALVTAVLFRDGRHSHGAFSQDASYLFASDGRGPDAAAQLACERWFDVGQRTIECTKNMMGFVLYAALALHGEAYFASYLEQQVDLASAFADLLERTPDFELAVRPEANIVCFRYVGDGSGGTHRSDAVRLDELQSAVRHAIIESGAYYLVETTLRGRRYLRTTLIEPHTTLGHLEGLLEAVRSQAGRARTRA
jgi:L-2,4-diaminobutyrate decarboxylase